MTIDPYTRIVLTVIAECLVYLCVRDAAPSVQAQTQPPRPLEAVLVGVKRDFGSPPWDPLVVSSPNQRPMDVTLVGVDRSRFPRWDDLGVRVNEPLKVDTSQPLKVKVETYPPIEVKVTNTPLNVNVANTNR